MNMYEFPGLRFLKATVAQFGDDSVAGAILVVVPLNLVKESAFGRKYVTFLNKSTLSPLRCSIVVS
jgi:hypothetical protein